VDNSSGLRIPVKRSRHAACVTHPRLRSRQSAAAERSAIVSKCRGILYVRAQWYVSRISRRRPSIALTSQSAQHVGRASAGLLNVVSQDTAQKGRSGRPFQISVTAAQEFSLRAIRFSVHRDRMVRIRTRVCARAICSCLPPSPRYQQRGTDPRTTPMSLRIAARDRRVARGTRTIDQRMTAGLSGESCWNNTRLV
jgi:hypothetical protein